MGWAKPSWMSSKTALTMTHAPVFVTALNCAEALRVDNVRSGTMSSDRPATIEFIVPGPPSRKP